MMAGCGHRDLQDAEGCIANEAAVRQRHTCAATFKLSQALQDL